MIDINILKIPNNQRLASLWELQSATEVRSVEIPVVYSHQTHYNFPRTDNKARQYDIVWNVDPFTTRRSQKTK